MFKKISILSLAIITLASCDTNSDSNNAVSLNSFEERLSYGLGADIGSNFLNMPDEYMNAMVLDQLELGFVDGLNESEDHDDDECKSILESAFSSPDGIDTSLHDMNNVSKCYGFIFGDMLKKDLKAKEAFDKLIIENARIGFAQSLVEEDTLIDIEERDKMIADFNNDMNLELSERVMNEAKSKDGAIETDKGVVLFENEPGNGEKLQKGKEYRIIYTMTKAKGDTVFSTNMDPNKTAEENAQILNDDEIIFPNGWTQSANKMEVGGDYTLYIPYDMGFGEQGFMNQNQSNYIIPPYSTIILHSKVLEQSEKHSSAKKRGKEVLAEAKKKPNTKVGKSGYVLEVLEEGSGAKVKPGSDVKAHYILSDSKGQTIENSYMGAQQGKGVPSFSLNGVVQGWQEAVPEMRKGGRYKLYLPYDLAYGEQGNQSIPPFETLTFEMEIIDFGEPGSLTQQQPGMAQ